MRYTRQGVTLEYDDIGNGVPLLLIPAFPMDRTMWRSQVSTRQLACRVSAPNLRGFGQSTDTDGQVVSMETYAQDVRALLDALNVKQAVIGGLSMGGYIALAFVAQYADRVKGLILANTRATADTESGRQGRYDIVKKVGESGAGVVADSLAPKMLGPSAKPETATLVRNIVLRQRAPGITSALLGMAARPDRTSLLPFIKAPPLIIGGSADVITPPADAEAMHAANSNSQLVIIPDAGHLSNLDKSDAFNDALREFIGKLS